MHAYRVKTGAQVSDLAFQLLSPSLFLMELFVKFEVLLLVVIKT